MVIEMKNQLRIHANFIIPLGRGDSIKPTWPTCEELDIGIE